MRENPEPLDILEILEILEGSSRPWKRWIWISGKTENSKRPWTCEIPDSPETACKSPCKSGAKIFFRNPEKSVDKALTR